jgi:GNAT superfamily N-acetyltransferase
VAFERTNAESDKGVVMIFEILMEGIQKNEVILVDGGMCHFHVSPKNRRLTIYEIIVLPEKQGKGIGSKLLEQLKTHDVDNIVAKCPADLPSNEWYKAKNFRLAKVDKTKTGREMNTWVLQLQKVGLFKEKGE